MKKQPNILLIVADQFRADMLGCAGVHPVRTPNLDALAARGCRFSQAYTPMPVCAPARMALLSGLNPDSFGAICNNDFIPTNTLRPGRYFTEQLHDAGYSTALLGKWNSSLTHTPADFGYDRHISWDGYTAMKAAKYPDIKLDSSWFGCDNPIPVEDSKTHWLAAQAAGCMQEYSGARPWHIRVDYTDPHLPNQPSHPFTGRYRAGDMQPWAGWGDTFDNKPYIQKRQLYNWRLEHMTWRDWAPTVARYYAMVSQLDDSIGRMIHLLAASGQLDDTIIIFTSDHGDMCGSHGMIDKHYVLYDDVVRIPLIISGAACGVSECDNGAFVSLMDIAPTIRELCGLEQQPSHGQSLMPMLNGDTGGDNRRYITSSGNGQQFGLFTSRMIRTDDYKLIWNLTDIDELYDLNADPGELINLADDSGYAEIADGLRRKLYARLREQGDLFMKTGWLDRQVNG